MAYQKKGCKGWYGTYRDHTGRVQPVKGDSEEEVELKLAQIKYNKKHRPAANLPPTVSHKTFASILPAYYSSKDFVSTTLSGDGYTLNKYILPILGTVLLKKITTEHIQAVVDACRETKIKNVSINKHLALVKSILNYAYNADLLDKPVRVTLLPDDRDVIYPPTQEEFHAILRHAKPSTFRLAVLSALTGVRPGRKELFSLTWDDVDFNEGILRITSAKKRGIPARFIPLTDQLRGFLAVWRDEDGGQGHIVHYFGRPITKSGWIGWHNTLKRAGITRRLRPYDLRHYFATYTLGNGADLRSVSDMMGHKKPTQTLNTYQHVIPRAKLEAVNMLPTIDYKIPAKPLSPSELTTNKEA